YARVHAIVIGHSYVGHEASRYAQNEDLVAAAQPGRALLRQSYVEDVFAREPALRVSAENYPRHGQRDHTQHKEAGQLIHMAKFETLFHYDSVSIACNCEPNILARFVAWIPGLSQICGSVTV